MYAFVENLNIQKFTCKCAKKYKIYKTKLWYLKNEIDL